MLTLMIHAPQRTFGDEEDEGSSSENSAGEEEIVVMKKSKGVNKIMDLPSVSEFQIILEKSNFVTGDGLSGDEGHAALGRQEDRQLQTNLGLRLKDFRY